MFLFAMTATEKEEKKIAQFCPSRYKRVIVKQQQKKVFILNVCDIDVSAW